MSSPTVSAKIITKWPFFLGDGIFLGAMIALLALADRPISGSVAAAAVVCLIGGVALTLIPFLIENENRVRLAESSGSASDGHHLRKLSALAEQLSNSVSRSQSSTEQIERALTAIEESNDRLADLVENLSRGADNEPPSATDLSPVLEAVSGLASSLQGIHGRLEDLGRTQAVTPRDLRTAVDGLTRQLEELEARWLTRWDTVVPTPPEQTASSERAPVSSDPEDLPESEPIAEDTPSKKPETKVRELKTRVRASPRIKPETRKSPEEDPNHDLGIEIPESTSARYVFNDRSTSIIATAYIGIGNKLTIRGTGPGLSWEKGVPMQFLSIGKWGWSALDVEEPVVCRIYRNDEEPSLDGDIELQPTELREINPRF